MKKILLLALLLPGCSRIESFFPPKEIVVWQSQTHIAFPSVEKLETGELVCVFRQGTGHVSPDGNILLVRSLNGGRSWTRPDTIIDTRWDSRDPSVTQISNGSLLMTFFQSKYDSSGKIIGPVGVFVAESLDGGYTWYPPRMVLLKEYDWAAVSSKIIELPNGALLLPVYAGKKGQKSEALVIISRDFGKSWSEKHTIASDSTGRLAFHEPALVRLPDNRILAIHRTAGDVHFQYKNYSNDGGKSWSRPTRTNLQGQAAGLLLTANNILLCGYRDFSPKGTSYAISYDYGLTFERESVISLFDHDRAYPEFVSVGDHILAVYYQAQAGDSKILASFLGVPRIEPPTGLVATLQSDSTVALRWNAVKGAYYYQVYRAEGDSTNRGKTPELIATVMKNYYNDNKQLSGSSYRIKAISSSSELVENSGAESAFSDPAEIRL